MSEWASNKTFLALATVIGLCLVAKGKTVVVSPPDGNATPRVAAAVASLESGDLLAFEPGEYHFHEGGTVRRQVRLINGSASCGEKNVAFWIEGLNHVTIDGRGARFIWHGNVFPFAVTRCSDVTLKNFTAAAARPAYAECEIVAFHDDGCTFRFKDPSSLRLADGGRIVFDTDLGPYDSGEKLLSIHSLVRCRILYLFAGNGKSSRDALATWFMNGVMEKAGACTYRVRNRHQDKPGCIDRLLYDVGEPLAIVLNQRERATVFLDECRNARVGNVHVESGDGMGLACYRTENLTVDGFHVVPAMGSKVSTTADGLMLINDRGKVEILNSEIAGTMDDAVNVHGNYLRIVSADGRSVSLETIHSEQWNFHPYHVGDEVEFSDPKTHDVLLTAHVVEVRQTDRGADVVVDRDVSVCPKGTLVEDLTWIPDVRIANCHFHDTMHLRLSGRGKWLVESNRMERGTGLLISDLGGYWGEAGRTSDMTIRNNFFDSFTVRRGGGAVICAEVEGRGGAVPRIHRGIKVLGNRWRGTKEGLVDLPCADDPVVAGNSCLDETAATDAERNQSGMMNRRKASLDEGVDGGVRVLFLGNSITLHASAPKIGWTNEWGMAASAKDRDYVHLVTRGIEAQTGRRAEIRVRNLADFERNYRTWNVERELADLADFHPDYLVIALGENVPDLNTSEDRADYRTAFGRLVAWLLRKSPRAKGVVRGVFWSNPVKDGLMREVAESQSLPFVRTDVADRPEMTAKGLFWHQGVQNHPGDRGMEEIARRIVDALFPSASEK